MRLRFTAYAAILICAATFTAVAQQRKPQSLAQLDLASEVATTTDDGQPAALRITLKNIGSITVDLPMPGIGCSGPDGAVQALLTWHSNDPEDKSGYGFGCGGAVSDRLGLVERVRKEWIRLRPNETLTFTENLRSRISNWKPGTVEYQVEYEPPSLNPEELKQLEAAGYVVPTEEIRTEIRTFAIH